MSKLRVLFIYRNPAMGISIGKVYKQIEQEMHCFCDVDAVYMPCENYSFRSLYKNIRYLRDYLKDKHYDILHITGAEYYLINFFRKENIVVTLHDLGFYTQRKKSVRLVIKKLFFINPLKKAKKVICISEKTMDEGRNICRIDENKLVLIHDPIGNEFHPVERKFNEAKPVFLQIGTKTNKNLENTILALSGIPHSLRIIGRLTENQVKMLQENSIEYTNAYDLSDEEIVEEYANCDIVNFISMHEGFGLITAEGQAVGRVVVTSEIPPMPEVAGDGAVFVDPYSIESIRNGYRLAIDKHDEFVKKGFENVKRFSVKTICENIYNVYLSAIKEN